MGWSESGVNCKKHSNESQTPGVCSSCLREKLSQISTFSHNRITTTGAASFSSTPSSSLAYFPDSSSNYASPNHRRRRWRDGSEVMSSISFMVSGSNGLKKSRSMTFVRRSRVGDVAGGKKKGGFWSKLLWSTGKRTKEVFMHSRTVTERLD